MRWTTKPWRTTWINSERELIALGYWAGLYAVALLAAVFVAIRLLDRSLGAEDYLVALLLNRSPTHPDAAAMQLGALEDIFLAQRRLFATLWASGCRVGERRARRPCPGEARARRVNEYPHRTHGHTHEREHKYRNRSCPAYHHGRRHLPASTQSTVSVRRSRAPDQSTERVVREQPSWKDLSVPNGDGGNSDALTSREPGGASNDEAPLYAATSDLENPEEHAQKDVGTRSSQPADQASAAELRDDRPHFGSVWVWPAVIIALAALVGAVFGPTIALLIAGQVIAILIFAVAARLGRNEWLAGVVALTTSSVLVFAGVTQLGRVFTRPSLPTVTGARSRPTVGTGPADLRSRNVTQQAVRTIDFRHAQLTGAKFDGLDLRGRILDGVDASGASFRGSHLEGASLRGTMLRGACLRGAHLQGADLTGADLAGADIAGAEMPSGARKSASVWPSKSKPSDACG